MNPYLIAGGVVIVCAFLGFLVWVGRQWGLRALDKAKFVAIERDREKLENISEEHQKVDGDIPDPGRFDGLRVLDFNRPRDPLAGPKPPGSPKS